MFSPYTLVLRDMGRSRVGGAFTIDGLSFLVPYVFFPLGRRGIRIRGERQCKEAFHEDFVGSSDPYHRRRRAARFCAPAPGRHSPTGTDAADTAAIRSDGGSSTRSATRSHPDVRQ